MDINYLHIFLSHIPAIATAVVLVLLIIGISLKSEVFIRVSLWILVITGGIILILYFSGEPAASNLKSLYPDLDDKYIEAHESISLIVFVLLLVTAVYSLLGLIVYKESNNTTLLYKYVLLVIVFISVLFSVWSVYKGLQIRHPELRIEQIDTKTDL
ncbi:MAG: hypothetical protein ACP5P3_08815 [Ignavibacteria bacterium]